MWFGFLLALFIGGFSGIQIGLTYHLPVAISMLVGAIIGGLSWKPREVARALARSVREVIPAISRIEFKETLLYLGKEGLDILNLLLSIAAFVFAGLLWTTRLLPWLDGPMYIVSFFSCWVVIFIVQGEKRTPLLFVRVEEIERKARVLHRKIPIGVPAVATLILGLIAPPAFLCVLGFSVFQLLRSLVRVVPEIAFRFTKLVATQQRLTIMASCGVGVFLGSLRDDPILGGMSAMFVGTLVTEASKLYLKRVQRQLV